MGCVSKGALKNAKFIKNKWLSWFNNFNIVFKNESAERISIPQNEKA